MAIYEYQCPEHGTFEVISRINSNSLCPCPKCGKDSRRLLSSIGFFRVHHTEKLDYNDPVRVYDRQHIMKDTAVRKALSEYKEEVHEKARVLNRGDGENA